MKDAQGKFRAEGLPGAILGQRNQRSHAKLLHYGRRSGRIRLERLLCHKHEVVRPASSPVHVPRLPLKEEEMVIALNGTQ